VSRSSTGTERAIRHLAEARQGVADVREETARELAELQASIARRVG